MFPNGNGVLMEHLTNSKPIILLIQLYYKVSERNLHIPITAETHKCVIKIRTFMKTSSALFGRKLFCVERYFIICGFRYQCLFHN